MATLKGCQKDRPSDNLFEKGKRMMNMDVSAAILIGRSTRMGRDKALLVLGEQTFVGRLAQEFSECREVFLSAALKTDYSQYGLRVLADENQDVGPIEGIRQSLRYAKTDYVFICAVDMPFVKKEMIRYLTEFISSDYDAYVFRDGDRIHPLCGIYTRAVLPAAQKMIADGRYRLRELLSRVRTKYVDVGMSCFSPETLRNINTPADYSAIRQPLLFCVSGLKNCGKTHLVERLIPAFIDKGLSVGVIKHDGHSFECDVEGTDSYRFYRAGARAVAVFSGSQSFVRVRRKMSVEELVRQMGSVDVIIIEGMKDSAYPKVEVIRGEVSQRSVCDSSTLLCIASDTALPENGACPVFHLDDTEGILDCIMAGCQKLSEGRSF